MSDRAGQVGLVATELLRGRSPAEIATATTLSINTVRSHISHVYDKTSARNREGMWRQFTYYRL